MTISIIAKPNVGTVANGVAYHNPDGTITLSLPLPSVILDREMATKLGEYLLKETN